MKNEIKLIIFDLDGVLADARDIHYHALNRAIEQVGAEYSISREEHASTFDGLPTIKKLALLTERKGLPPESHKEIWENKQTATLDVIRDTMTKDYDKIAMMKQLKKDGFIIYCASNSISRSLVAMLYQLGLLDYLDYWMSNQDVKNPKPDPEMYLKCMVHAGVSPRNTLIVEDSHTGRKAALEAGAHLCGVEDHTQVTYERVKEAVKMAEKSNGSYVSRPKWQGKDTNVLIPMAGAGSRFEKAGYTFPKPLIDVAGKPMIQAVVENLNIDAHFIFIVQREHYDKYNLGHLLNLIAPNCDIIQIDGITEGAACTTLLAKELIDSDKHLVMANSDQIVEWDSNEFMYSMISEGVDGGILSFTSTHPKWSFARLGEDGFVAEVAEKKPISDIATVGIYYWKRGSDYVKYAEQMIEKNIRVNNEFYVCPVFNEAIGDQKKIRVYPIEKMWGVGTPEDLQNYLRENHSE